MRLRGIQVYVGSMAVLALGALSLQEWDGLRALFGGSPTGAWDQILGWCALLSLALISESFALSIKVGRSSSSTSSIIFLPLLTSVLLFGPTLTVLLMAVTGAVGEFLIRKKETIRAVFNAAQYVFSTSIAGWVFLALGGQPLAFGESSMDLSGFFAFVAFGFVFLVVNHAAVSLAITLNEGVRLRKVWSRLVGRTGTNVIYDIAVSPIAIAVAFLYLQLYIFGLFLIVLPLLFIRHAYLTILQLQQANRDLLKALVKAIETRDPYTSGHSLRVASLAVRIADGMGLSPKRLNDIETAAMLHDIGKIEAIYTEILGKPENLTAKEREIIESHVTKGVELLEQLSSFPKEVVDAVRGHHERVDGKGYPVGLRNHEIPLAARIIKVCDAIDAMLSDRPYRKALDLSAVREQLEVYSGTQFDPEVVKAVLTGSILEKHAAELAFVRGEGEVLKKEQPAGEPSRSPETRKQKT
jgi:putative nucleotidyltransferase with HDIG domain